MISAVCAVPRGACAPQPRAAKGGAADSDAEDDAVRASDAVFLAGRTEDDFSCVEMYVYDDEQGSLYVHHDVRLEAFPLALAFLQHGSAGARVAVGTMEPRIDVWDLDVMEPAVKDWKESVTVRVWFPITGATNCRFETVAFPVRTVSWLAFCSVSVALLTTSVRSTAMPARSIAASTGTSGRSSPS